MDKMMESKKNIQQKEERPLYKMKMFSDVGSKVIVGIKNFKSYNGQGHQKTESSPVNEVQIDSMIEKIENELKEMATKNNENHNENENENE